MGISRYPLENDENTSIDARLLYVTYSKFENDWPGIAHSHHFAELCYIKSGKGIYLIKGTPYPVSETILSSSTPTSPIRKNQTASLLWNILSSTWRE